MAEGCWPIFGVNRKKRIKMLKMSKKMIKKIGQNAPGSKG
jgi:hypothetical protein